QVWPPLPSPSSTHARARESSNHHLLSLRGSLGRPCHPEGGTHALRSQARFAQGTATEGSASRRTPEATDPSQAQDDIVAVAPMYSRQLPKAEMSRWMLSARWRG